jgi:hypothetical protein
MTITKDQLDTQICDFYNYVDDVTNTETFREYIQNTEIEFDLIPMNLDGMSDKQLNEYLDFLDYLWEK